MKVNIAKIVGAFLLLPLGSGLVFGGKNRTVVPKKRQDLDQIVIPVVPLEDCTIREAIDFAWSRAVELDDLHVNPDEKGVSISVRFPARFYPEARYQQKQIDLDKTKFSYRAKQVTLTKLLIEIAKRSGFDLYTTSVGVVFCPPRQSPFPNSFATEGEVWEVLFKQNETDDGQKRKHYQEKGKRGPFHR